MGPREARRVLAVVFSSGSAAKAVEDRLADLKEETSFDR